MRRLSLQHNSGGAPSIPPSPLLTPTPPSPGEEVPGAPSVWYPYARLRLSATNPVPQIESAKREVGHNGSEGQGAGSGIGCRPTAVVGGAQTYLSDAEFEEVMQMKKIVFYSLPKWKQDNKKKALDLF